MSQQTKKYCGSGIKAGQYDIVNVRLNMNELNPHIQYDKDGNPFVKISVGARKNVSEKGATHSVWIDEYVGGMRQQQNTQQPQQPQQPQQQQPQYQQPQQHSGQAPQQPQPQGSGQAPQQMGGNQMGGNQNPQGG